MSARPVRLRVRVSIWLAVAAGLAIVAAGNWHLVHVALSSQPECVAHVRLGDGGVERSAFSAARSACSPTVQARTSGDLAKTQGVP